ncbi:MAG: PACE efflux transporter [Azoarcus sp.]|jgi:uncharacterized membrane protein|nr:PACE efflux transporter [Azoarcus sp.]
MNADRPDRFHAPLKTEGEISPCPPLRKPRDRLRLAALFEATGLLIITPLFAWASGTEIVSSFALLAVLSVIALAWNTAFNTVFDLLDGKLTGRRADRRPIRMRILHAMLFEIGILSITLPVLVLWTGMGWLQALIADLGLALAYVIHAFFFHLCYDRLFPIRAD